MPTNRLRCFIASAFGHEDVDATFTVIKRVLRELEITPVRVDRVEHNDDIDDLILASIDSCDVCIADLTYARPSVYYEAGRVDGLGKPVIYIARKDHFRPKDDDEHGNYRVHFDLLMKNIIPWHEDRNTFERRLRTRLSHVLRSVRKGNAADDRLLRQRQQFERLSLHRKLDALAQQSVETFAKAGWKPYKESLSPIQPIRQFYLKQGHHLIAATIWPRAEFSKSLLGKYYRVRSIYFPGPDNVRNYDKETSYVILTSLKKVSASAVAEVFSDCECDVSGVWRLTSTDRTENSRGYVVIGGIRSAGEYGDSLQLIIDTLQDKH